MQTRIWNIPPAAQRSKVQRSCSTPPARAEARPTAYKTMLNFERSDSWIASSRRRGRGRSFDVAVLDSNRFVFDSEHQLGLIPTLSVLSLRSLESSLGKGLATLSLHELPLGLAEKIYQFVFSNGSRMAQMEISRALAPILSAHVNSLDFNSSGAAKFLGDSALCELALGCGPGLVRLDLSACRYVTDAGILGALLRCPAIRSLSLSGCDGITDEVCTSRGSRVLR